MNRKFSMAAVAVAVSAAALLGASSASATTVLVRQSVSISGCTADQDILQGYGNSSHDYQGGEVVGGGSSCQVQITQFINGNQGASSGWYFVQTVPYYDGPGFQDQVCVRDGDSGPQNCSTKY